MIKRRDLIKWTTTLVPGCFLLREAFGETMAPPPGAGLKSNHNYYLYNDGKPIRGLVVTVELTKDVVCDDLGFHVQLNANSPLGSPTHWYQYVMGFNPDFQDRGRSHGPVVGASIEYFSKPHSFNTGDKQPPNVARLEHLPGRRTLPAGAKFTIAMKYDGDDISACEFTYADKDLKDQHRWTIPVPRRCRLILAPPSRNPACARRSSRSRLILSAATAATRRSSKAAKARLYTFLRSR